MLDIISNIIHQAGGQAALARLMGVSAQAVHQWKKKGYIPLKQIPIILNNFPSITSEQLVEAYKNANN